MSMSKSVSCPHGKAGLSYCAECLSAGRCARSGDAADIARRLEPDALRVWLLIGERLLKAREVYGPLELSKDTRDFRAEASEELLDAVAYLAMELERG